MKKIILVMIMVISFTGCVTNAPQYDNNEYASVVKMKILTLDMNKSCLSSDAVNSQLPSLKREVLYFNIYSKHLPDNNNVYEISGILTKIITEMDNKYTDNEKVSNAYCQHKTGLLLKGIDRTLDAVANKYRLQGN